MKRGYAPRQAVEKMESSEQPSEPCPCIGDKVYVDDIDLCHGSFIMGGVATVDDVWMVNGRVHISVAEVPGASWLWSTSSGLSECQNELRERRPNLAGQAMIHMADGSIEPLGD